jgi:hypothetical protein
MVREIFHKPAVMASQVLSNSPHYLRRQQAAAWSQPVQPDESGVPISSLRFTHQGGGHAHGLGFGIHQYLMRVLDLERRLGKTGRVVCRLKAVPEKK